MAKVKSNILFTISSGLLIGFLSSILDMYFYPIVEVGFNNLTSNWQWVFDRRLSRICFEWNIFFCVLKMSKPLFQTANFFLINQLDYSGRLFMSTFRTSFKGLKKSVFRMVIRDTWSYDSPLCSIIRFSIRFFPMNCQTHNKSIQNYYF